MKADEIKNLIGAWPRFSKATPADLIADMPDHDEAARNISLISSRKEYWEPMVCLIAYDQDPANTEKTDEMVATIVKDIRQRSYSTPTIEFLDFCDGYTTISNDEIKVGMEDIFSMASTKRVADMVMCTSRVLICQALYGDDEAKLRECLAKP